jgi:hypothetical protein
MEKGEEMFASPTVAAADFEFTSMVGTARPSSTTLRTRSRLSALQSAPSLHPPQISAAVDERFLCLVMHIVLREHDTRWYYYIVVDITDSGTLMSTAASWSRRLVELEHQRCSRYYYINTSSTLIPFPIVAVVFVSLG